jgi:hypothetical protein
MADEARLALMGVRVAGLPADVYVYDDRIVIATGNGERVLSIGRLERVATRRNWRGASRLLLALSDGEVVEIRKLDSSATGVAHRTIVGIARDSH